MLGHAVWQGGLAAAVLDGTPLGHHRAVGRPKPRWIDGLTRWCGLSVAELTAAALQRHKITTAPATQPGEVDGCCVNEQQPTMIDDGNSSLDKP